MGSKIERSGMRHYLGRIFATIVGYLLKIPVYDTQCGAKIFKKDSIQEVINLLGETRWAFDIDLLYKLSKINSRIKEVPIKWKDDPRTNLNLKKAPIQMFLAIVRLRLRNSLFKDIVKMYDLQPELIKLRNR